MDGKARYFDITDPFNPVQTFEDTIGSQVNMISQSWDGKRAYFSTSLLGNWDKTGKADEQWVKLYEWDDESLELSHKWTIDFYKEKLVLDDISEVNDEHLRGIDVLVHLASSGVDQTKVFDPNPPLIEESSVRPALDV